ncbi:MAG: hypothetical protein JXA93_10715, partial [Anaerolineae bacterium]|nr:hypothetical protein [Anaerolineae bacterium]
DPALTETVTVSNVVTIDDGVNPLFTVASPDTTINPAMPPLWRFYLPTIYKGWAGVPPLD